MTDYAKNHAQLPQVRSTLAGDLGPEDKKWPPSLGLFDSVVVTLTYLRRNRVQEELAETYGTSQPTISRAISLITSLIKKVLAPYVPTADTRTTVAL